MRIDGINLVEGSSINNATLASGADFPDNADIGELFYISSDVNSTDIGLYVYNGTAWARVTLEGESSGINFNSAISGLSPATGGAFTNGNTLQEALQAIVDTSIGNKSTTNVDSTALNELTTVGDLFAIPSGKAFVVNGASTTASFLNTLTAALPLVYSVGNVNARDTFVKLYSTVVSVSGVFHRKSAFLYAGQSNAAGATLPRRILTVTQNQTTSAVSVNVISYAISTEIPISQGWNPYSLQSTSDPWVTGKDSKITAWQFSFSKNSSGSNISVNVKVTLNTTLTVSDTPLTMFATVLASTINGTTPTLWQSNFDDDGFGNNRPIYIPVFASSSTGELLGKAYVAFITKYIDGILHYEAKFMHGLTGAQTLPSGIYVGNTGY